jgi:hypothetical protein
MSEGESVPAVTPRKSKAKRIFLILVSVIALGIAAEQIWWHYTFPYGWSHCCDIQLGSALEQYAEEHGGHFPSGGDCPEASLSLLYSNYADANLLRGKIVPVDIVERALATKGKLGPDSCGWHYVEGLTLSDDPRIAIVWDKVGLGHNGQRLKNGGHSIILANGFRDFVSGARWPQFLEEQKQLLSHRGLEAAQAAPALTASIRLPGGEILTNCSGTYELATTATSPHYSGTGGESGENLKLRWFRLTPDECQMTWVLTLPEQKLRSKPVTFTVTNGQASPNSITFEMGTY